jgi:uncharacterized protein YfbU (UPF0304 family)
MLYRRISKAFKQQQQQAEIFKERSQCVSGYCGDMNSAYLMFIEMLKGSWRLFEEAGCCSFGPAL